MDWGLRVSGNFDDIGPPPSFDVCRGYPTPLHEMESCYPNKSAVNMNAHYIHTKPL